MLTIHNLFDIKGMRAKRLKIEIIEKKFKWQIFDVVCLQTLV